jgi:uncharacterized repeat protein (TIGR01451 family)
MDSTDPVLSGAPLTYTIEVRNAGTQGASSVLLRDQPNANFTYTGFSTTRGACALVGSVHGGRLDCDLGNLGTGPAAFAVVTISGHLTAIVDTNVDNVATVDPDNTVPESNEGNNSDTETTRVLARGAPPSGTPGAFTQGDVDGDGEIDSVDALWVLWLEGHIVSALPVPPAGDVNKDGRTNAIDALLILQIHAGA